MENLKIEFAKSVLPIFEKAYPNDKRPRLAIESAENWVKNPTEENRKIVAACAADADYAADVAYAAAACAYVADVDAADAACAVAAYAAADAAYAAAADVADAAAAAAAAAYAACMNTARRELLSNI